MQNLYPVCKPDSPDLPYRCIICGNWERKQLCLDKRGWVCRDCFRENPKEEKDE